MKYIKVILKILLWVIMLVFYVNTDIFYYSKGDYLSKYKYRLINRIVEDQYINNLNTLVVSILIIFVLSIIIDIIFIVKGLVKKHD